MWSGFICMKFLKYLKVHFEVKRTGLLYLELLLYIYLQRIMLYPSKMII